MLDALIRKPGGQIGCDVARPVVGQEPWPLHDPGVVATRCRERQVERVGDILGLHGRAQLPGDDIAREVVEDGGEIEPSPADDLQIGEVGLPELVRRRRLVLELVGGLDDDEGRAGDQVLRLEQPVDRGFRDEVAAFIGEGDRQLARRQLWLIEGKVDDLLADVIGDTVPDPFRPWPTILECVHTAGQETVVPAMESGAGNAELLQC